MLAEIQSQITSINIDILTTPSFKKTTIKRLKQLRTRLLIIACLPLDEIDESDLNAVYGES